MGMITKENHFEEKTKNNPLKLDFSREFYFDILSVISLFSVLFIIFLNEYVRWDFPGADYSSYVLTGRKIELSYFIFYISEYPLYCVYIRFFEIITGSVITTFYSQILVTIFIAVLLIYIMLRSKINPAFSFILACIFLLTCFNSIYGSGGNTQYLFSFIFICLLFIMHHKAKITYKLAGLVLVGVGVFFRPELILIFYLYAFYLLKYGFIQKESKKHLIILLLIVGFFSVPFLKSLPGISGRSELAFGQHFAVAHVERNHLAVNPWMDFREICESVFDKKDLSMVEAFFINPVVFLKHLVSNFLLAGKIIPESFLKVNALFFYIMLLFLLHRLWRAHGRETGLREMKAGFRTVSYRFIPYLLPLILFVNCIALYPFKRLLLPIIPLVYLAIGLLIQTVFYRLDNRFLVMIIPFTLIFVTIDKFVQDREEPHYRINIEISRQIDKVLPQISPNTDYRLLSNNPEARVLCALIDKKDCIPVETWLISFNKDKYENITMDKFIDRYQIDLIFLNDNLKKMFYDSEIKNFLTKELVKTNSGTLIEVLRSP